MIRVDVRLLNLANDVIVYKNDKYFREVNDSTAFISMLKYELKDAKLSLLKEDCKHSFQYVLVIETIGVRGEFISKVRYGFNDIRDLNDLPIRYNITVMQFDAE